VHWKPGWPGARRHPARSVDVGLGDAVATEDFATARRIAGDTEIERGLDDALQLQREVVQATRLVVEIRGSLSFALEQRLDRRAGLARFDGEEILGLHETDRSGMMRRIEDPREDLVRDRVGAEGADVASPVDGRVNAPALLRG